MTKAKDIRFEEYKRLPTLALLKNDFGIEYDFKTQQFNSQIKLNSVRKEIRNALGLWSGSTEQ